MRWNIDMKKYLSILIVFLSLTLFLSCKPKEITLTIYNNNNSRNTTPTFSTKMTSDMYFPVNDLSGAPSSLRFIGFTDGKNTYLPGQTYTFKEDTTLIGMWEKPEVSYDYADGTPIKNLDINYGDWIVLDVAPERDGYKFESWVDQRGGTYDAGDEVYVAENYFFTAEWEELERYTVTVDYGNKDRKEENYTIMEGEIFVVPDPGTIPGYTFLRWGNNYETGDEIVINKDIKLSAIWSQDKYNIDLKFNDGADNTYSYTCLYGESFIFPELSDHDNYLFIGWTDGKDIFNAGDEIEITSSVSFNAVWEEVTIQEQLGKLVEGCFVIDKEDYANVVLSDMMNSDPSLYFMSKEEVRALFDAYGYFDMIIAEIPDLTLEFISTDKVKFSMTGEEPIELEYNLENFGDLYIQGMGKFGSFNRNFTELQVTSWASEFPLLMVRTSGEYI